MLGQNVMQHGQYIKKANILLHFSISSIRNNSLLQKYKVLEV